jgi:hypothetical protein
VELGAAGRCPFTGRLMAAVTHVCSIDYAAKMLGEDAELLEVIIYDDNLTYKKSSAFTSDPTKQSPH